VITITAFRLHQASHAVSASRLPKCADAGVGMRVVGWCCIPISDPSHLPEILAKPQKKGRAQPPDVARPTVCSAIATTAERALKSNEELSSVLAALLTAILLTVLNLAAWNRLAFGVVAISKHASRFALRLRKRHIGNQYQSRHDWFTQRQRTRRRSSRNKPQSLGWPPFPIRSRRQ
jgi:hypothetical protein